MSNKDNDHTKIVFCLRRQIRAKERSIEFATETSAHPLFIRTLRDTRKALLKVLQAYQLATYRRG